MPTTEESIGKLAATSEQDLLLERQTLEKVIPLEQRQTVAGEKGADAHARVAGSAEQMQLAMAEIAKNIDPMKADQRDLAIIAAAALATCGDFITSATEEPAIRKTAEKALLLTDLVWAGIKARLPK
jgi:hypothetical protein